MKSMISTRITNLLGIEHPIIQGAMGWVSFPPLVAAVSNAGGLGILATAFMPAADLRRYIRETKELTDRPFGVNLIPDSPDLEQQLDIVVRERVPIINYGIGDPKRIIERARAAGIIAMPTVGALKHAVKAEQDVADAVIVQGTEAGGHSSRVATVVLVPLVVDHVKIPVVAAGGFADGRGLAAALALGAEGISMGTRFIATQESPVPLNIKQRIINSTEEDTVVTGHLTGIRCRVLKNKLAEGFVGLAEKKATDREMLQYGIGKIRAAFIEGDEDWGSIACGQAIGLINDLPTCREVVTRTVEQAMAILGRLQVHVSGHQDGR